MYGGIRPGEIFTAGQRFFHNIGRLRRPGTVLYEADRAVLEIAFRQVPQEGAHIGDNTDVMGGCAKCRAMELMIRAMSPQVLITDEIATAEDAAAVMDASGCGIRVIASAHAGSAAEIMRRRDISGIIAAGAFDKVLLLKKQGTERRLYDITEELT